MPEKAEIEAMISRVGEMLNRSEFEDYETLQAIYDTLRWAAGDGDISIVEVYFPT